MSILAKLFGRSAPPETAADRREWIDTTLRTAAAHVHAQTLAANRDAARSFESAETPAWTDSWPTECGAINEDLKAQLPTLISRARGFARNNEWAQKYLLDLHDNVCGATGIRLQMRLRRPAPAGQKPALDIESNEALEAVWEKWCKQADVAGYPMTTVEKLALDALERDGAILYRLRPGAGPLGFQIQLLPVTLLDVSLNRSWGGNRIRMGVEINDDGAPVAYWLQLAKPGDAPAGYITAGRHVRIPAAEIRHAFPVREVGQLRGIPGLADGGRRLWLTKAFEESAAVASVNAARRQGFFYSPNGDAPRGFADQIVSATLDAAKAAGKELTPDEVQQIMAAAEKYNTTVPGQFDTLPQGYQFQAFESQWPNVSADAFTKSNLRAWCSARGVSYNTIGNDLESVNYSSAQVGIIPERERYKSRQADLIAWLHAEVFAAALPYLILQAGSALSIRRLPDYLAAATWQGRRWVAIDPVKGASSDDTRLKNKTTTRRRIWLEQGVDPDEMAAEVLEDIATFGPLESAPATPAAPPDPAEQGDQAATA